MTRRTVADEPKYYDFEIALTVDPIWCEEDEDGPRIDYRGDIRKVEEEDVVGRVRFFVFHFDTTPWDPADAFDHVSETAVYAQLLDEHGDLSPQACKALGTEDSYLGSVLVFDRLELLPEARGQGLGLKVLARLISKFGLGCRIAVMKSFPLQLEPEESSKPDEFELDVAGGGQSGMGFRRVYGVSAESARASRVDESLEIRGFELCGQRTPRLAVGDR